LFLTKRLEYGVAEDEVGTQGLFQFREPELLAGVEGAGDLVEVVSDPPEFAEDLAEGLVVGGRTALGAGAGVAKGGGAHEGSESEARFVGLGGDPVEFVRRVAKRTSPIPLPRLGA
jgi:hypothetical protein